MGFINGLPRFRSYDSCLVVTCGLSCFTGVFPCNKKITGEQTVKMLVEQWFEPYGAPKQGHSDEDLFIRNDTGWHKRLLNALNVEVTTGVPTFVTTGVPRFATGEWLNGEAGEGRGSEPCAPGGLSHQAGGASWRAPH